jgi:3-oxoacyl-[acyl-carrier protein] reductase
MSAYSPAGVRLNTVASGPVYTSIRPDEIASMTVFLVSSRASYITGAVIAADGGRTAI